MGQAPSGSPIRSEATGGESNSLILLDEWQKRLPPKRWVARERAPSPEAAASGEGANCKEIVSTRTYNVLSAMNRSGQRLACWPESA